MCLSFSWKQSSYKYLCIPQQYLFSTGYPALGYCIVNTEEDISEYILLRLEFCTSQKVIRYSAHENLVE